VEDSYEPVQGWWAGAGMRVRVVRREM